MPQVGAHRLDIPNLFPDSGSHGLTSTISLNWKNTKLILLHLKGILTSSGDGYLFKRFLGISCDCYNLRNNKKLNESLPELIFSSLLPAANFQTLEIYEICHILPEILQFTQNTACYQWIWYGFSHCSKIIDHYRSLVVQTRHISCWPILSGIYWSQLVTFLALLFLTVSLA